MTKRLRLIDFGRESHVSNAALSQILVDAREFGIPDAVSGGTMRRQRKALCSQKTSFGPLVQQLDLVDDDGAAMSAPVQHPLAALEVACKQSPRVRDTIAGALQKAGGKVRMILYTDEVTPGQQLNSRNYRKCHGIYWTLADLPPEFLCVEEWWFTLSVIRTSQVDRLDGGMSQRIKRLLHVCFAPPYNLKNGVQLDLSLGSPQLVFGEVFCLLQDLAAHKLSALCKGHSGHKLCPLCQNVVSHKCPWLPDHTGRLISSACLEVDKYVVHTKDTVTRVLERLQAVAHGGGNDLPQLETFLGFNHSDENAFLCPVLSLDMPNLIMFDWMHILFISGTFVVEMCALFGRLDAHSLGHAQLGAFLTKFCWPGGYESGAKVCCDGKFGGSASEMRSATPVIALYLMNVVRPTGVCAKEVASALLLCDLVGTLTIVNAVAPRELETAVLSHLRAHVDAYGREIWIPKHHYSVHLAPMLQKFGFLLNTFVQERKHRVLKAMCTNRHNTTSFDTGVLEDMTCQGMHDISASLDSGPLRGLKDAHRKVVEAMRSAISGARAVRSSRRLVACHRTVMANDVVAIDSGEVVAEVWFHAEVDGFSWSCVSPWPFVEDGNGCCKYRKHGFL
ncbi:unnamed protein product [Prorocentrum cordatum]|uniref:RING-type E3 ubiquitin transferase n=1 Tax=Prorocentrum cordatum TaxID=2364126 RepID=A0ABN9X146_9DINO|nr:unnamed protein product [Polarella glacialis]